MVDSFAVTHYDRKTAALEEFLLFAICVAGKKSIVVEKALERFLSYAYTDGTPFEVIRGMIEVGGLELCLKESRLGQYTKLARAFTEVVNANLDLRTCTAEDLEKIHGIGFKTSRFFIVHSRPEQQYAILDVHILHFMKDLGFDVPESTPTSLKKYQEIEKIYLKSVHPNGYTVAAWDLFIWTMYSTGDAQKIKKLVDTYWS